MLHSRNNAFLNLYLALYIFFLCIKCDQRNENPNPNQNPKSSCCLRAIYLHNNCAEHRTWRVKCSHFSKVNILDGEKYRFGTEQPASFWCVCGGTFLWVGHQNHTQNQSDHNNHPQYWRFDFEACGAGRRTGWILKLWYWWWCAFACFLDQSKVMMDDRSYSQQRTVSIYIYRSWRATFGKRSGCACCNRKRHQRRDFRLCVFDYVREIVDRAPNATENNIINFMKRRSRDSCAAKPQTDTKGFCIRSACLWGVLRCVSLFWGNRLILCSHKKNREKINNGFLI